MRKKVKDLKHGDRTPYGVVYRIDVDDEQTDENGLLVWIQFKRSAPDILRGKYEEIEILETLH